MSLQFKRKIEALSLEELNSERATLYKLLTSVIQEYQDRKETIFFINNQIEEVNKNIFFKSTIEI